MTTPIPGWAHRDARGVCPHLAVDDAAFLRVFHPGRRTFDYVCKHCAERSTAEGNRGVADLAVASAEVVERLERSGFWDGVVGFPGAIDGPDRLALLRRPADVRLDGFRAVAPVVDAPGERWIVACDDVLLELDGRTGRTREIAAIPLGSHGKGANGELVVATDRAGRFVAVAQAKGRHGVVLETASGRVTMRLDRGDYHEDVCEFPVAFADVAGRTVLVHATAWNRLDCSDPSTGAVRTERASPSHRRETPVDEHYLDYFFCGLSVSPAGRRIVSDGWMWSPCGVLAVWDLQAWLSVNPWESEDGPTRRELAPRLETWDAPRVWLDDRRLAVWGFGVEEQLHDGVRVYDAETGAETDWFPGPVANLAADGTLVYSLQPHLAVYEIATGRRLLVEPDFAARSRHPRTGSLLAIDDTGRVEFAEVTDTR
ncbi:hypothetical protein ACIBSV_42730 [Embleya sp. NPDC050154]|uniref:hypothetical protein n=1 Tax=Embleya sp. NPDC050154 TaxID=3363988 RepID=UPI0037BA40EB